MTVLRWSQSSSLYSSAKVHFVEVLLNLNLLQHIVCAQILLDIYIYIFFK